MVPPGVEQGLRRRYAEAHRAWHTQAHVDAMLAGLVAPGATVHDHAAANLAIWFHDAVYDPAARDNEARSAELLRSEMAGHAPHGTIEAAAAIVLATADHALPPAMAGAAREDCALVLDLDMAVLGAAAAAFDDYERAIAAEYVPVVGAAAFRTGRAAFLRGALARPRLFHTDRFHAALDAAARGNLRRALSTLAD